jgi:hypothetical protein
MAQQAIETDESTEGTAPRECQQCGEESLGQPFYPMRDTVRNATGEFIPTREPDGPFCDVQCQRQFDTEEEAER